MKFHNNGETILESDQEYREAFLDYYNNFLTVDRFAAYYGWSTQTAKQTIEEGRALHESNCKQVQA